MVKGNAVTTDDLDYLRRESLHIVEKAPTKPTLQPRAFTRVERAGIRLVVNLGPLS